MSIKLGRDKIYDSGIKFSRYHLSVYKVYSFDSNTLARVYPESDYYFPHITYKGNSLVVYSSQSKQYPTAMEAIVAILKDMRNEYAKQYDDFAGLLNTINKDLENEAIL